jgi:hypothetical protein
MKIAASGAALNNAFDAHVDYFALLYCLLERCVAKLCFYYNDDDDDDNHEYTMMLSLLSV